MHCPNLSSLGPIFAQTLISVFMNMYEIVKKFAVFESKLHKSSKKCNNLSKVMILVRRSVTL